VWVRTVPNLAVPEHITLCRLKRFHYERMLPSFVKTVKCPKAAWMPLLGGTAAGRASLSGGDLSFYFPALPP
ncbi:MAG: hypothetical protein LBC88_07180, partial [Spirochaetaceae bacterium]|nr:hypothetical protein [Spirochaetaceae bacterium]